MGIRGLGYIPILCTSESYSKRRPHIVQLLAAQLNARSTNIKKRTTEKLCLPHKKKPVIYDVGFFSIDLMGLMDAAER